VGVAPSAPHDAPPGPIMNTTFVILGRMRVILSFFFLRC
jgi:hypothetical protein